MRKPISECADDADRSKLGFLLTSEPLLRQETLTRHKPMVAEYLDENYDRVSPAPAYTSFQTR